MRKRTARFGGKSFVLVWVLFAALLCRFPAEAADVALSVELPGTIEARGGAFYLGEYAMIEGAAAIADSASMALLTPEDGRLTREAVVRALGTTLASGKSVALRMPEAVRVLPESRIASELRAMTGWKWRIEIGGVAVDDRTDFSLPPRVVPGARALAVRFPDGKGGAPLKHAKLKWHQPVVYATKALVRDERIDPAVLAYRIDTVGMADGFAWDAVQLQGAQLRQGVGAYRPIELDDVEQAKAVRSGSSVMLIARVNGLGIEVQGIAMQRGGIGDVIKVKNLSSKKILTGKIVAVGRVEIL